MRRRPRWQQDLSRAQVRHLTSMGITTRAQAERCVMAQEGFVYPCWDCVDIGRALGIKVELKAFHARQAEQKRLWPGSIG